MSNIVHIGLWDNYDLGVAFSKVLTVPYRTGTIIIALLAILVTFTANRSWKIWRFLLHALLGKLRHHVRIQDHFSIRKLQAILRNSETTGAAFMSLLQIAYSKGFIRNLNSTTRIISAVIFVLTLLHWILFIALGTLTTQVNIGSVVRSANTDNCGLWLPKASYSQPLKFDLVGLTSSELSTNTTIAAENYVRNCYTTESASISDCNVYMRRILTHTTALVPCPLRDQTLCSGPNAEALAMESGNISFADLGLNWRAAREFSIRRRSVCTPISSEPFLYSEEASVQYAMNVSGNRPITSAQDAQAFSFIKDKTGTNITRVFVWTNSNGEYEVLPTPAVNGSFAVDALQPRELAPGFIVISIRGRSVIFPEPSDDPIFYAQENLTFTTQIGSATTTKTFYTMGRPLNSMVCQDMAKVCSNITGYCTGWVGPLGLSLSTTYAEQLLGSHSKDNNSIIALTLAAIPLIQSSIQDGFNNRGASALQATRHLQSNMQYAISKEQWKIEAEHWFRISLATLQMGTHRMITTPEVDRSRVVNGMGVDQAAACSMVKFRSTKHVTLSMFGILTIVVVSVLLLLISSLDDILNWLIPKRVSSIWEPWERNHYLRLLEENEASSSEVVDPVHTPTADPDTQAQTKRPSTASIRSCRSTTSTHQQLQAERMQQIKTSQDWPSPQNL